MYINNEDTNVLFCCQGLGEISDRLYCAAQALLYGDEMMANHNEKIAEEIGRIWEELDCIARVAKNITAGIRQRDDEAE